MSGRRNAGRRRVGRRGRRFLGAEVTAEVPVQVAPDAEADRPDGGPVDVGTTPDSSGCPKRARTCRPIEGRPTRARTRRPTAVRTALPTVEHRRTYTTAGPATTTARRCCTLIVSLESLACESGVCHAYTCAQGYAHVRPRRPTRRARPASGPIPRTAAAAASGAVSSPAAPGSATTARASASARTDGATAPDAFGCETALGAPENCGACGRPACALANVLAPCRQPASSCDEGICAPGYGNCDRSNPDCEAAYGASGTCVPRYAGTACGCRRARTGS